jgi:hypothetical protein
MSVFYDEASLVVVPSGYKSGKIYAQKPLTTAGQLTFTRSSTATRVNASGLIESVASGVPRLDYTDSTCPKLLLEPQRTNVVRFSEQMDDAAWTKAGVTVTANQEISPDGNTSADYVQYSGASTELRQDIASTTAGTVSVYLKGTAGETIKFGVTGDEGIYTLTGNWQRLQRTFAGTSAAITINTYSGATARNIYLWGAQVEVGTYATSYIPTTSAAVTRLADIATKTGISSLIGSTEGVLFVEADMTLNSATSRIFIDVNDNDLTNRVLISISNNLIGGFVQGVTRVSYTIPSSGRYKIAFGYKSGDFVLYVNGVQRSTSSDSVTFSGMSQLFLGHTFEGVTTQPSDPIAQVLFFKTRLSNAKLAELTSL